VQPPCDADAANVRIEPIRVGQQPARYTENDLHVRQFTRRMSRRMLRKGQFRAA